MTSPLGLVFFNTQKGVMKLAKIPKLKSPHDDSALNIQNLVIDTVNQLGNSMLDLVASGQLTPTQYSKLLQELNGLISKGQVSIHDIDKNKGLLDQSFLSPELLKQISGTAPVLSSLADGAVTTSKVVDRAITPAKTNFITSTNTNLFDGAFDTGGIILAGSRDEMFFGTNNTIRSVNIPIRPGKSYLITRGEGGSNFNIGTYNEAPTSDKFYTPAIYFYRGENGSSADRHQFYNSNANYLSIQVNFGADTMNNIPSLAVREVNEDGKITLALNYDLEGYPKLEQSEKNLFDGVYDTGWIVRDTSSMALTYRYNYSERQGRTAIIPIESNKTYSVSVPTTDLDRFVLATNPTIPSKETSNLGNIATEIFFGYDSTLDRNNAKFTFTNNSEDKYLLVYVSADGLEPPLQVEEGSIPTSYEPPYGIPSKYIPIFNTGNNGSVLPINGDNLFDGNFDSKIILAGSADEMFYGTASTLRSVIFEIQPNAKYTIRKGIGGDTFKIATFNVTPTVDNMRTPVYHFYRGEKGAAADSHTFTNTNNAKFMSVQVNGTTPVTTLPELVVTEELSGGSNTPITSSFNYQFSDELYGLYGTNAVETFSDNPGSVQTSAIYAGYDALMAKYPDFISRHQVGTTPEGIPMYYYKFTQQEFDSEAMPFKRPKIIVTSGLHGDEKSPVYSTYNMFKKICEEWKSHRILEFFRFNIDWIVMPVCNPDGFNMKSRRNKNAVDLNRNFPTGFTNSQYSGPNAISEHETPILMDFFKTHKDAEFLFDFHNMFFRDEALTFGYTTNNLINDSILQTGKRLGRYWQKTYNYIPQDIDHKFVYTRPAIGGAMATYANSLGITDEIIEVVRYVGFKEGSIEFDETTVVFGVDILVNNIVTVLKNAWRI